jgi:hypothetical protein
MNGTERDEESSRRDTRRAPRWRLDSEEGVKNGVSDHNKGSKESVSWNAKLWWSARVGK